MYSAKIFKVLALLLVCLCHACTPKPNTVSQTFASQPLTRIAFGSCSHEDDPQPIWQYIRQNNPQLWIWMGDNVYGDTYNMDTLRYKYHLQKNNPDYQKLTSATPIIGIWDDHDYGVNDGGKEYPKKHESQQLMLDFLGEPTNSERRRREGAYTSYTYGPVGKQVKIILLDARYFRDAPKKEGDTYLLNQTGTILGEAQWQWLEKELYNSKASIHLLVSGIQILPEEHRFEKWANFPKERERLLNLIASSKAKGVVMLSGDRHIAEISRYTNDKSSYPIYEVTASGLTHSSEDNHGEPNRYRVGNLINVLNFGCITINWNKRPIEVQLQVRGLDNKLFLNEQVTYQ